MKVAMRWLASMDSGREGWEQKAGQVELLEADGGFGGHGGAGRGSVDGDAAGLVGLEELFVDGDGVVDAGGEWVLGREAVEDGDDLDAAVAGDGDGFGVGAGVGVE